MIYKLKWMRLRKNKMDKTCSDTNHKNEINQHILLSDGLRVCVQWLCTKCGKKRWEICKKEIIQNTC